MALAIRFLPLFITYPLASRSSHLNEFWWRLVLFTIQVSSLAFVCLFIFRFSSIRKQRPFSNCDQVFDNVFGDGFAHKHKKNVFLHIEPYSIGSGCVAQIYKATVNITALEAATGNKYPHLKGCERQEIAVKVSFVDILMIFFMMSYFVIERGVDEEIDMDLSILKSATSLLLKMLPSLEYMQPLSALEQFEIVLRRQVDLRNEAKALKMLPSLEYMQPLSALEQFEIVLRRQVDLRNEAKALKKFSDNFEYKKTGVKFPIVIGCTKNVLVETFEQGIHINRLISEDDVQLFSCNSPLTRRRIALLGARALLKMIFVDNFVHGDLHPGNILVRFNEDNKQLCGVHIAPRNETIFKRGMDFFRNVIGWRTSPLIRFTDSSESSDEPTLIILDTGIVFSETEKNLRNLKALFRAIIDKKGYRAGELLLDYADNNQRCSDPHEFCVQVDQLVAKAMKKRSLKKLNISTLLSELFSLVAAYNVYLDSSFTSVVLSVMVLEGLGRSLDPDIDLFQCARPYLLNMV
ncbi:ABC1 family protein [Dictyocaulus viviparus]|uniref:ABC1 family protein n=1 Tax=Dictyocaulus viviparus TaxID=29172 RepID=A0A0D8X8H5_DICVI|nr:ABC1 family protein [Dictyocaulus viviparus]